MLRLQRYIIALVIWLAFLFNIERLDVDVGLGSSEIVNLATPVYFVVIALAIVGIMLPRWKRVPLWHLLLIAVASFGVAHLVADRALWGGSDTYVSLFELAACLVTVAIAGVIGNLVSDFVATVRNVLLTDSDGRVVSSQTVEPIVRREMQLSRRTNRPLSVVLVDTEPDDRARVRTATAREVVKLLAHRYQLVAVTRVLMRVLRRTDFVIDQTDAGRLVVILPALHAGETEAVIERLNTQVRRTLGVSLRCGVASFPENGLTFEELVFQAEHKMESLAENSGNSAFDTAELVTLDQAFAPGSLDDDAQALEADAIGGNGHDPTQNGHDTIQLSVLDDTAVVITQSGDNSH